MVDQRERRETKKINDKKMWLRLRIEPKLFRPLRAEEKKKEEMKRLAKFEPMLLWGSGSNRGQTQQKKRREKSTFSFRSNATPAKESHHATETNSQKSAVHRTRLTLSNWSKQRKKGF